MRGHTCGSCRAHQTVTVNVTAQGDQEQHFLAMQEHEDGTVDVDAPVVATTEPYEDLDAEDGETE